MNRRAFLAQLGTAAATAPLFSSFVYAAQPASPPAPRSFLSRLLPAPVGGGFRRDDSWIWCGSVIRGDDGLWHMFASMWTKSVPFNPNWLTNSRVVRATATNPLGPYTYVEDILPPRDGNFWDGKMTHNPTVHRVGNTFLLFYTGTTYDGPIPTATTPVIQRDSPLRIQARANQRIGLATAPSPAGRGPASIARSSTCAPANGTPCSPPTPLPASRPTVPCCSSTNQPATTATP